MGVWENQQDRRLKFCPVIQAIFEQEQIFGFWAGRRLDVLARGALADVPHVHTDYME